MALAACADPAADDRCRPGPGATGSPRTIEEALTLVNSLPMPVTAECFAESLDRPLRMETTQSVFSAQPAVGTRSPRIFIFYDPLTLSIVPEGDGRELLEFGELVGPARTLKGEISFPVEAPLSASAPYSRIHFDEGGTLTTCAFCHGEEEPSARAPGAFTSVAFQPSARALVPLGQLLEEHAICDEDAEPDRCRYLDAIVAPGPIEHQRFPAAFPVFTE